MLAKWWINSDTFGPSGAGDISIKIRETCKQLGKACYSPYLSIGLLESKPVYYISPKCTFLIL
jgi:hypothetical protein